MKVKSFGCSFIFGNELADDAIDGTQLTPSLLTWPALVADKLSAEYQCYAQPGSGNLKILEQILHQAALDNHDTLFVIGWTYVERFDYVVDGNADSRWRENWETITPLTNNAQSRAYYQWFHTELKDKLSSLIYVRTAIDTLKGNNIPFVMTCMDDLLLDRRWHVPKSITATQDYVEPYLNNFEGKNFLSWSQSKNFAVGKWMHPLEQAHMAAAELMIDVVRERINSGSTQHRA